VKYDEEKYQLKEGEKHGGYRQSYVARATSPQAGDQKKAH
jgi:hypothetical protein